MSITKDGFYNIEGKMFEVVHGVEGDCLILGDEDGGTRISGPKPWGGGQVTKTFVTKEKYGPIERLEEENDKLRKLVAHLMFVKPNDVSAILYKGELLRFEDLLAEVGMRWVIEEDE